MLRGELKCLLPSVNLGAPWCFSCEGISRAGSLYIRGVMTTISVYYLATKSLNSCPLLLTPPQSLYLPSCRGTLHWGDCQHFESFLVGLGKWRCELLTELSCPRPTGNLEGNIEISMATPSAHPLPLLTQEASECSKHSNFSILCIELKQLTKDPI